MECPKCKLDNPPGTVCCECGFAFSTDATSPEASLPRPRGFLAASMGRRLAASVFDSLVVVIFAFLCEVLAFALGYTVEPVTFALAGSLFWLAYMTVSQAATRNTLGKYLLG